MGSLDNELVDGQCLSARASSARISTSFMAHRNLLSTFTVQDLRSQPANVMLPCTTNSVHFPFLCSMYECSSSKTTLLPCYREPDCRDVPPDHRFCSVVELKANLLRTEESISWFIPAPVNTLSGTRIDWHILTVRWWACSYPKPGTNENPRYIFFLKR